jgi:DNA modification methylase
MDINKIYAGKMEDVIKQFPDNFFDSCITDPPYGIRFMGKKWDYDVPSSIAFGEILRVLKPGAHILVACGTRTQHRMAVNIEDAGFEIRDVICWHYGQGFPKSRNLSKDIDDEAGVDRPVIGTVKRWGNNASGGRGGQNGNEYQPSVSGAEKKDDVTGPATDQAKEWDGWGTALKPATEFWTLARKPISEPTIANNVIEHGTGALNIDACRIEKLPGDREEYGRDEETDRKKTSVAMRDMKVNAPYAPHENGRWPANVTLDEVMKIIMDEQGEGASRFFYCPKPETFERNKGLDKFTKKPGGFRSNTSGQHLTRRDGGDPGPQANYHPTVKPIDLMRWLVKLITPKGGTVIDPYCGSGSTLIGAKLEMKNWVGIEMEEDYCKIAEARVKAWNPDQYIPQQLF